MNINCFPCFSKPSQTDSTQAFLNASKAASKKNRVTTSGLEKLLKKVENSPKELSKKDFEQISGCVAKMSNILRNQHSDKLRDKLNVINNAFSQAKEKLTSEAIDARAEENSASRSGQIQQALQTIRNILPALENKEKEYRKEIADAINRLPDTKAKSKAREIIGRGHYSAFSRDSAITQSLFPDQTVKVEREYGYQNQRHRHPDADKWTSLEDIGVKWAGMARSLNKAQSIIKPADKLQLTSQQTDRLGDVHLTPQQKQLLEFASKFSNR
ncbi:hypothetical protein BTJ39_17420 [Izhakiella australiensis]|uniref:Uncharacterized protein n=1 Tax=Izhakiella australiensis TaxID=1926881 RepID=A0A1S8YII2_9GAMM|nr:hypothetical protein [Izhakiella australiensis]OON38637.1 hypothetical protein BTJ39_17420 [Izhakiella australiensis]